MKPAPASAATAEQASGADGRMPVLDGVRGLAILLVMQYHFYGLAFGVIGRKPSLEIDRLVLKVAGVGWSGVDLFFVLSGFLITGILYDAKNSGYYFRNFYARRFLRIFPLYYGFLLVVLLVLPHIDVAGRQAAIPNLRENQFWFWTYLVNIWSAITPLHSDLAIVHSHFWSLAVEEQFYLVWPAVVLVFGRRRLMGVCAALAAGALVLRFFLTSDAAGSFAQLNAAHVLMPARMDTLALGAFIALAVRGSGEMARLVRWAPIVAGAALLALVALFVAEDGLTPLDHRVATIGLSLLALLFAALLVMAVSAPPKALLHRLFAHPALRFAGRYAYALYVFHLLIAFDLAVVWNEHGLVRTVAGSQLPANLVFSAAGTSIALMLAWLSWHLYEKQFLKLKRFVPYGRGGERARAPRERAPLAAEPSSIPAP